VEWKVSSEPWRGGTLLAPTPTVFVCAVPVGAVIVGAVLPVRIRNEGSASFGDIAGGAAAAEAGRDVSGPAMAGWLGCAPEKAVSDVVADDATVATLAEGEGRSANHDVVERNAAAPDTASPRGTAATGPLTAEPAVDCSA
jgi:hypothetical protein